MAEIQEMFENKEEATIDGVKVEECSYCNKGCQKWIERKDKIKDLANAIVNGKHFTNDIEGHLKELAKEIINICEES